jgi:hypothetical protein
MEIGCPAHAGHGCQPGGGGQAGENDERSGQDADARQCETKYRPTPGAKTDPLCPDCREGGMAAVKHSAGSFEFLENDELHRVHGSTQ